MNWIKTENGEYINLKNIDSLSVISSVFRSEEDKVFLLRAYKNSECFTDLASGKSEGIMHALAEYVLSSTSLTSAFPSLIDMKHEKQFVNNKLQDVTENS